MQKISLHNTLLILLLTSKVMTIDGNAQNIIEQKIIPNDGAAEDYFGTTVSISGDYAIIGSPLDDDRGRESGSAYIYKRSGNTWIQYQKLTASDGKRDARFGTSVSIDGDYAIVGAMYDSVGGEPSVGSAYVFKRLENNWIQYQKLIASDGDRGDDFGYAVSIKGRNIIVGADNDEGNGQLHVGSAYIYSLRDTTWIEQAKIQAKDGSKYDKFGHSVAITLGYAVVGAYMDSASATYSGSAYIFKQINNTWIEQQKLIARDGIEGQIFGIEVFIDTLNAIIGASGDIYADYPGAVYVYRRYDSVWVEEQKLVAGNGNGVDYFGLAVSKSNDYIVVGAPGTKINGNYEVGATYIFKYDFNGWSQYRKILASDGGARDWFGTSVSLSEGNILVGSTDSPRGLRSGAAYIYRDWVVGVETVSVQIPVNYFLAQNYPNPFNASTIIRYQLREKSFVSLKVYDVLGNEVITLLNEEKGAGIYAMEFESNSISSGIYVYRLVTQEFSDSKKFVFLK
jgi:hypothetical protein